VKKVPSLKSHQLDKTLRSFGPRESMTKVIKTRQELYLSLFERIWDPRRLGLPVSLPTVQNDRDEPSGHARRTTSRRRPASLRTLRDRARWKPASSRCCGSGRW